MTKRLSSIGIGLAGSNPFSRKGLSFPARLRKHGKDSFDDDSDKEDNNVRVFSEKDSGHSERGGGQLTPTRELHKNKEPSEPRSQREAIDQSWSTVRASVAAASAEVEEEKKLWVTANKKY
jgi:hypothetical protein